MDSPISMEEVRRENKEFFDDSCKGTIGVSDFVKRQTEYSPFSYFDGSWTELLALVNKHFDDKMLGYRYGVLLVPVPPENFYSSVKILEDGDELVGDYSPRKEGETPRKHLYASGNKVRAKSVEIVLYHKDVLEEDGDRSTDCDWEVISVNASPTDEEIPMQPNTLIANHFHFDGGTQTNMSNDEFVAALKDSVMYWKDKAMVNGR